MVKFNNLTLSILCQHLGLSFDGVDQKIEALAEPHEEGENLLKFLTTPEIPNRFNSNYSGWLLKPDGTESFDSGKYSVIQCANPYHFICTLLNDYAYPAYFDLLGNIDSTAEIHPTAYCEGLVAPHVKVGPFCVIEKGAQIGEGSILGAHVVIRAGVQISKNCVIQSGAVIGETGFGFLPPELKSEQRKSLVAIPHFAGVLIHEDVSIGANTTIAAGFLTPTTVGARTKIDAQVLIAHNCKIGSDCILAGQSGMAGSCHLEDHVTLAGGAQLSWKVHVGKGAIISAKAGVIGNVPAGELWSGFPARPHKEWLKGQAWLRRQQK